MDDLERAIVVMQDKDPDVGPYSEAWRNGMKQMATAVSRRINRFTERSQDLPPEESVQFLALQWRTLRLELAGDLRSK